MDELFNKNIKYVFGGFVKDKKIQFESTSGGAFSAIVDVFCDENYVVFGAEADGLKVFHNNITNKKELYKFRKSKYSQSQMGNSYRDSKQFLDEGKKVLFSGTPCQIAGLKKFLSITHTNTLNLLTVEIVCEGVPSPLYMRKYEDALFEKFGDKIASLDYRYTGKSLLGSGKWDFEIMKTRLLKSTKEITIDRWFNPFWSIWIRHLISRPSCYQCPFARQDRTADISLGDLWGVHLYCPELYGKNKGASLVFANTKKGKEIVQKAQKMMYGHCLKFEEAIKYQGPMRKHIDFNPQRESCMADLMSNMTYKEFTKKWNEKPTLRLLWQKYVWGNRQKISFWNFTKGKYKIK